MAALPEPLAPLVVLVLPGTMALEMAVAGEVLMQGEMAEQEAQEARQAAAAEGHLLVRPVRALATQAAQAAKAR